MMYFLSLALLDISIGFLLPFAYSFVAFVLLLFTAYSFTKNKNKFLPKALDLFFNLNFLYVVMMERDHIVLFVGILLACRLSNLIAYTIIRYDDERHFFKQKRKIHFSKMNIFTIFLLAFLTTGIANVFELAVMGKPTPNWPFKLAGIINYLHSFIAPFLCLFVISELVKSKSSLLPTVVTIFIVWIVFETITINSRGIFLEYILFLWLILYFHEVKFKTRYYVIVGLLVLMLPVISLLRNNVSFGNDLPSASDIQFLFDSGYLIVLFSFLGYRVFGGFDSIFSLIGTNYSYGDVLAYGSFAKFRTFEIDEFSSVDTLNSSGSNSYFEIFFLFNDLYLFGFLFGILSTYVFIKVVLSIRYSFVSIFLFFEALQWWCLSGGIVTFFTTSSEKLIITCALIVCFKLIVKESAHKN